MKTLYAREVAEEDLPQWLSDAFYSNSMFLPELDVSEDQLHFICPSGIGDFAWIWSKLQALPREGRDCTFYFPDASPRRLDDYCRLIGAKYQYLSGIDIGLFLDRHTPWGEGALTRGNVLFTQANSWLEEGNNLVDWLPWLTMYNPAPEGFRWRPGGKNVCVYTASHLYPEGNWFPAIWGDMLRDIEQSAGPVQLLGALWDEEFYAKIQPYYEPSLQPVLNKPLEQALEALCSCAFCVGVASGLTILSVYMGVPTLIAYPRKLAPMPGTWEMQGNRQRSVFVDELQREVAGRTWEEIARP